MACSVTDVRGFPGVQFTLGYPEAIGDIAGPFWFGTIKPVWEERADGAWLCRGEQPGQLTYEILMIPGEDSVTSRLTLTNRSDRTWKQGMAFNCVQCSGDPWIRDHECLRTWVRSTGQFKRLIELPRVFGPRPAIQLYSVEGAPPARDIPFVANFRATPEDVVVEPWIAIVSRDGKRLVATVSTPGLFLFQNREYSCIHSGAGFGQLKPGETGEALNTSYFVRSDLDDWYTRITANHERLFIPS